MAFSHFSQYVFQPLRPPCCFQIFLNHSFHFLLQHWGPKLVWQKWTSVEGDGQLSQWQRDGCKLCAMADFMCVCSGVATGLNEKQAFVWQSCCLICSRLFSLHIIIFIPSSFSGLSLSIRNVLMMCFDVHLIAATGCLYGWIHSNKCVCTHYWWMTKVKK